MQYKRIHTKQAGLVSILTVLMFSILIAVLLTGFTRIMIQEQQDTLQDDLSKSAYNSAQAGIEDAKRAIQYCAANPGPDTPGARCSDLYNQTCPGFNAGGAFTAIGIASPGASGTVVGDPGVNQRYTCVIISGSTDIQTTLNGPETTNNTAMYKLESVAGAPYNRIELRWHHIPSEGAPALGTQADVNNLPNRGNVRQPDWGYPALMRATVLATDNTLTSSPPKHFFLYPTNNGSTTATTLLGSLSPTAQFIRCASSGEYACTALIDVTGTPATRFIVLQPFYKGAKVSVKILNNGVDVPISDEQITVDATGAASNVFRRVQARIAAGDSSIATSSALDVGTSICKDFFVSADTFTNDCNN